MNYEAEGIVPFAPGKAVKVYFVELDDDDRERVISGIIEHLTIETHPQYEDIHVLDSFHPITTFVSDYRITMEAKFKPGPDGVYFRVENFAEEEEEE